MKKILSFLFLLAFAVSSYGFDVPAGQTAYHKDSVAVSNDIGWIDEVTVQVGGNDAALVTAEIGSFWVSYPNDVKHIMFWLNISVARIAEIGSQLSVDFTISYLSGGATGTYNIPAFAITVTEPVPTAYFSATSTIVTAGGAITFSNTSLGDPATEISWNFEGGSPATSSANEARVIYTAAGNYDVSLTVTNEFGSDTKLLENFITVIVSTGNECTELFISEYVEGSNNNKAIEIYNPTDHAIDLSAYILVRYSNGETTPNAVGFPAGTMILAKDAFVAVLDKQNCDLTGQDTCVWEELRNKADIFLSPDYNENKMMYFNGNDAVTLEKTNGSIIDIFGIVGQDPGQAWTDNSEGNYQSTQSYSSDHWTKDHTLKRKQGINKGLSTVYTSYSTDYHLSIEWIRMDRNDFSDIQLHACDCGNAASVNPIQNNDYAFIYPNPVINDQIVIKANNTIESVEIFNTVGQLVFSKTNSNERGDLYINSLGLSNGIYLVKTNFSNKNSVVQKIIVQAAN